MNKIIPTILSLFLLLSCYKDSGYVSNTDSNGSPVKVMCNLNVSILDDQATKTSLSIDENSVLNLWVLQFNGQEDASKLVKADYYIFPDLLNLNLNLLTGTSQSVYFIANTCDNTLFNPTNAPLNSYSVSALKSKTVSYTSEASNFTSTSAIYCLRMTGLYQGNISSSTSFSVTLNRLCAKIKFNYQCSESTNPSETGAIVKVVSVSLKNVPYSSKLLSNPSNTTIAEPASVIDYPTETTGIGETSGSVTFYMPENLRGIVSSNTTSLQKASNAPTKSTYIEVKGFYYPSGYTTPTKSVIYKIYPGKNAINDYNINSNLQNTVNISFKGLNISDSRITVNNATANCYIIAPNSSKTIAIGVKGNGDANATASTGLSVTHTAYSAAVLWQTSDGLINLSDFDVMAQKVKVTTNAAGTSGNAVIAVFDGLNGTGNILWSWHIWVTDYDPFTGTTYNFNGYNPLTWMDRNLGATNATTGDVGTYGLLYQWGRKDPFPNSSSNTGTIEPTLFGLITTITKTVTSASINLANSILNPGTFYYYTTEPYSWYSTTSANNNIYLWGCPNINNVNSKTIFDPCPFGWRVPPFRGSSPWSIFPVSSSTYGFYSSSTGYWPSAGARNGDSGNFQGTGSLAGYWSATADSQTSAYNMLLNPSLYSSDRTRYGGGRSIRCVKDF